MKISPRYDGDPLVTLDGQPAAIAAPLVRQRLRFVGVLAALTPDQWEAPTRCAEWRVRDVAAHVASVDRFWELMIRSGLEGEPTRFLANFDPRVTPAALVDAVRATPLEETLATLREATGTLCATVASLTDDEWLAVAESPVGHVTLSTLGHHALWDCWIHERDVCLPLGLAPEEHADEVVAALRYVAALSPAFVLQSGDERTGALAVEATAPDARFVVSVDGRVRVTDGVAPAGAAVLRGSAVELLEGLSVRTPLARPVAPDHEWMVSGLAAVFAS